MSLAPGLAPAGDDPPRPRVLAVIPAGDAGMDLRDVGGKKLAAWTFEAAKAASHLFTGVLVSTGDPQVAELARDCGVAAPFRRPPELAADGVPLAPVRAAAEPWAPPFDHARWIAALCWLLLLLAIPAAYRLYLGSFLAPDGATLPLTAKLGATVTDSLYPLLGVSIPLIQLVTWALLLELGAFTFALHSRQRPHLKPPPNYPAYMTAVAPAAFFGQLWHGAATGATGRPTGERLPFWLYLVMLACFLVGLVQTFILWIQLTKKVDDAQTALAPLMRGASGAVLVAATAILAGGLLVLAPRLLAGQDLPSGPAVQETPGPGLRHAWRAFLALLAFSVLLQAPQYPGPARLEPYIGLIACLVVLVVFARQALPAFEGRSRRPIKLLELAAVLLLAAQGLAFSSRSPLSKWIKNMIESEFVRLPGPAAWVFILILPLLYELLFRGLIYEGLARRLPALAAVAIAAGLFAAVASEPRSWVQVFLLGLTAGLVKAQLGSVWPAVLLHAATNSLLVLSRMGKFYFWGKAPFVLAVLLVTLGAAILYPRGKGLFKTIEESKAA